MGLDNIPVPRPCIVRKYALVDGEGKVLCSLVNCPYKYVPHVIGVIGTWCWLRGDEYEHIVDEATYGMYTLYQELTAEDLKKILEMIRYYKPSNQYDDERKYELIRYLETLLNDVENNKEFKLVPWW